MGWVDDGPNGWAGDADGEESSPGPGTFTGCLGRVGRGATLPPITSAWSGRAGAVRCGCQAAG